MLRARHAHPLWRSIPVIIMSALSFGDIQEGARILDGALIVLGKPPDLGHLRSSLSIIGGTKGA